VVAVERGEDFRGMEWPDGCDPQISLLEFTMGREKVMRFVAEFDDSARDLEKRGTRFRKLHASTFADEKLDAVTRFQFPYLNGERRLADAERAGGSRKTVVLGDGMEGPQVVEHYWHNQ
jgi:hypothetical protein